MLLKKNKGKIIFSVIICLFLIFSVIAAENDTFNKTSLEEEPSPEEESPNEEMIQNESSINLSEEDSSTEIIEEIIEEQINETILSEELNKTELINGDSNLIEVEAIGASTNLAILDDDDEEIDQDRPDKIRRRFNFNFYKYSSDKGVHETEDTDDEIFGDEPQLNDRIFNTQTLASEVNDISIDTPEIKDYFELYKNFSDIKINNLLDSLVTAKIGSFVRDNIKGIGIVNKSYIVHVEYCDESSNYCLLKVNGIDTRKLYSSEIADKSKTTKFKLDDNHDLKIKSIIFDYCDERRFCDYHYDAYDIVELEVEEE